jgi:hypothetical protein
MVPGELHWKALKGEEMSSTLLKKIQCLYENMKGIVIIGGAR